MSFAGLRVTLVGPLPPPAGGMANQTRQLAERLTAERATVHLVPSNAPWRPAWIGRLPVLRAAFRLLPYLGALWRAAGRCDLMHVMANSGWSWHLFAAPAIWVGRGRGVPVVVNYHGGEAAAFLARAHPLVRLSLRRAAALVVPSGFLQEVFAGFGMAARIVPNVVDLQRFRPREVGAAHAGPDGRTTPHLVVPRNLEAIYDNATALHAFVRVRALYPEARLTLAGSGPEAGALEALARELGLAGAVTLAGRLDRDGMADLLRTADLVLNPSRADNLPVSLLEALASGVPVVSTRVGGIPHLLRDGVSALLVAPGDAPGMAEAALRLLADDALRGRLVRAGLAEVERYTWTQVGPALAAVYAAALGRGENEHKELEPS